MVLTTKASMDTLDLIDLVRSVRATSDKVHKELTNRAVLSDCRIGGDTLYYINTPK